MVPNAPVRVALRDHVLTAAALLAIPVMGLALWNGTRDFREAIGERRLEARKAHLVDSLAHSFRGGSTLGSVQHDSAVTVLAFIDYECPACRSTHGALAALLESQPSARVVVLHYPLDEIHSGASIAADMAICAESQDAFDVVHSLLLRHDALTDTTGLVATLVDSFALDGSALHACLASDVPRIRVARDRALGERLGVRGTPTYFTPEGRMVGIGGVSTRLSLSGAPMGR